MKFLNPVLWAEEIDQLRAENERLKAENKLYAAEMSAAKEDGFYSAQDLYSSYVGAEERVNTLESELAACREDAERWQGLMTILQTAYSGSVQEFGEGNESLIIDCAMVSGYKTERRVQAVLSWRDVRDEPLDLATSLDKAIEAMKGK